MDFILSERLPFQPTLEALNSAINWAQSLGHRPVIVVGYNRIFEFFAIQDIKEGFENRTPTTDGFDTRDESFRGALSLYPRDNAIEVHSIEGNNLLVYRIDPKTPSNFYANRGRSKEFPLVSDIERSHHGPTDAELEAARIPKWVEVIVRDDPFEKYRGDAVLTSHEVGMNHGAHSIFQNWVCRLPYMQQAVIASGIRAMDGWEKLHQGKHMMRWIRRACMISSFEGYPIDTPFGSGGGSFTGSAPSMLTLEVIADLFINSRDSMSQHFYTHMMHTIQVIGYKHSDVGIRGYFYYVYKRMVNAMHVEPESQERMDKRLCDNEQTWRARSDESLTCSD